MDPRYPRPPEQRTDAIPTEKGGGEDAQARIEREARNVLRGFPVAAGLIGVADVISHLPPLAPATPSFFPSPNSLSLQPASAGTIPSEPLFDDYAREIAVMLGQNPGGEGSGAMEERWRQNELARLVNTPELRQHMAMMQQGGSLPPLNPPFPFSSTRPSPIPSTSSSLSHQFLYQAGVPLAPSPTSFENPSPGPDLVPPAENLAFLGSFVTEQLSRIDSPIEPITPFSNGSSPTRLPSLPSLPALPPLQPLRYPTTSIPDRASGPPIHTTNMQSSPDPLMMNVSDSSHFHRPQNPLPRSALDGSTIPQRNGHYSNPFTPSGPGRHRTIDSASSASPFPSSNSPEGPMLGHDQSMSPYPPKLGQAWDQPVGVESAVKRFKLESGNAGTPILGSAGSGRGRVVGGETKNIVDRLSDLLSDVFSADDSHILDTSTSALGASAPNPVLRSPSRTTNANSVSFFRTTAVSPVDSAPLLSSSTLSKFYKYVQSIDAKSKGEEMLEEVEDAGLSRLLRLLGRSWEGVADQTYWDSDATKARDEDEGEPATEKGKAKSKGKGKGKSRSPGTKAGKQRKSVTGGSQMTDEHGDEEPGSQSNSEPRRRSSRSVSRSRSPTVRQDEFEEEEEASQEATSEFWTSDAVNQTHRSLRNLSDALVAIRTALSILTLRGVSLPKHLFSSDYLDSLLAVLRHTLDSLFNPLLEAPASSHLAELLGPTSSESRDKISEILDSLASATDLLSSLIKQEDMADDLVNSAVFYALDPFFHEPSAPLPAAKRKNSTAATARGQGSSLEHALKVMRVSSLNLVRRIYARYSDQRTSIVEEVLGNLGRGDGAGARKGKGAMRLRNNTSIQTVSALLLHLVQTCSADIGEQVKKALAGSLKTTSVKDEEGSGDEDGDVKMTPGSAEVPENGAQGMDLVKRRLLDPAYDSALKSARSIIDVLLGRSSRVAKAAAGTADAEYRKVLDNLIADLLTTVHLPEWPGSQLFLDVLCRYMIGALADKRTSSEANALRAIALDHVGTIAARIRQDLTADAREKEQLLPLAEIVASGDVEALEKLLASQASLLAHLSLLEDSSPDTQGAADFTRILFARELSRAQESLGTYASDLESAEFERRNELKERIEAFSRSTWGSGDADDVFGPTPEDAQPRIDAISLELSRSQPLAGLYQPLITHIIQASESSQVTLRTKALRAIGLLVAQDPSLFLQDNVRQSVENRMHDLSPAVRDTTIELVGKHVVTRPDLAAQYLPQLIGRLSDSGLSVRRRVVKLLRVLYGLLAEESYRIDICRHLVGRVLDEDDGVKDLAVDTLEDLWFTPHGKGRVGHDSTSLSNIVLNVVGIHDGRVPPVEEALRLIVAKHQEKGTSVPLDSLREVMENLIDSLITDSSSMDVVACIKTVSVLSAVDPTLLSTAKATLLVPFLKGATTAEERTISDQLLIVFRSAALATPKTASKFGRDLQNALLPMLNRPSAQLQTLQSVISCFSAVIWNQTQDFAMMVKIFGASMNRLLAEKAKLSNPTRRAEVKIAQLPIVCYLVSLLCEHGDFDRMRTENEALRPGLDKLAADSIADFVFDVLIDLHGLDLPPEIKAALLTSLSFLWRAYPTLMIEPSSTAIIDAVFSSANPGLQLQILRIVQNFLASQEKRSATEPANKDGRKKVKDGVQMDELVGNVEGFADSGVASSIAQRYLDSILRAAVSTQTQLQRVGMDVISMVARSGFIHPLSLAPTLVALSACADSQVASKANSALTILHQKHASLLVTRFLEPAKVSHAYAKAAADPSPPRGYRGNPVESSFGRWFSLVHKEKRQIQLDYLKQLCRVFETEPGTTCTAHDVSLARFVAEALSTLDFKRAEEPMLVISRLNTILAVSGLQVLHLLEEGGGLLGLAGMDTDEIGMAADHAVTGTNDESPSLDLVHQSIVSGLALLLRDHLKQLYAINDAKMSKYVAGKKSAAGDKACTRRNGVPLALGEDGYSRMPFALKPLATDEDRSDQRSKYMALIREDGTIHSLEEGDEDDDDP